MEAQARDEMNTDDRRCPKCGFEETGYFCRNCGGLLHDDELVLCPRCRQVVPGAEYCNQCGQALGNLALTLQQLALAGDAFWIAGETVPPPSSQELSFLVPDESVDLAPAELPDWLRELPAGFPPEVQQSVYPALTPIQVETAASKQRRFLIVVILLTGLLLLSVIFMALFVMLRGGV